LKGLVKDWGLAKAGRKSDADAMAYLNSFYNGKPLAASFGAPEIDGRFAYTEDLSQLNFSARRITLPEVLEEIRGHLQDARPPAIYIGSTVVDSCLPGIRQHNDLNFAALGLNPAPSIWIGNHTVASAHYDAPNNIA
jgi:Cupin-like domain